MLEAVRSMWSRTLWSIRGLLGVDRGRRDHDLRRATMEERMANWGRNVMVGDQLVPAWRAGRDGPGEVVPFDGLPKR